MASTNQIYTKGNLLKELNIASLIRNTVVPGVVQQGQHSYAWMKLLEGTNNFYEARGTGNLVMQTYKSEVAFTGDPTVKAQVSSSVALSGGIVQLNFSDPGYNAYRKDDQVDIKFGGNLARVVETGAGYIKIDTAPGNTAPVVGDYPNGTIVIQRTRGIGTQGTKSPVGLSPVPQKWENYVSIIDDASQQGLFQSQNQTVLSNAEGYIVSAPIQSALRSLFYNITMNQFVSKPINPESNGFDYSATAGIHEQIRLRGNSYQLNTVISRTEFEARLRQWFVDNPGSNSQDRIVMTGSIGMAQISEWYKDFIKYDVGIAEGFIDGSVDFKGLNTCMIFIPGFERIRVVMNNMLNMNAMGERSTITGYTNLPKAAGNFYFFDFSPVQMMPSGLTGPAFQKIYFKSKYFFSYQQGLREMNSLESIVANATPLTMENMEITSTDNDFNNVRFYTMCGINVMNAQAHVYIENNV